jgi:hypothetical protein
VVVGGIVGEAVSVAVGHWVGAGPGGPVAVGSVGLGVSEG